MSVDLARFVNAKDDTGAADEDEAFLVAVRRSDRCVLPSMMRRRARRERGEEGYAESDPNKTPNISRTVNDSVAPLSVGKPGGRGSPENRLEHPIGSKLLRPIMPWREWVTRLAARLLLGERRGRNARRVN